MRRPFIASRRPWVPGAVIVAIPVRNEERHLAACLAAVDVSRRELLRAQPGVRLRVVVTLDRCTDGSAAIAAAAGVTLVHSTIGRVGAARAAGIDQGLSAALMAGHPPAQTWIACTDADTLVPRHWLLHQVELASSGVSLVVGTVEPDAEAGSVLLADWHAHHDLREGHSHVHGANLGIRGDTYLAAGGFRDAAVGEDVDLVRRARRSGAWVATDTLRVRTSARRTSRVVDGFAGYLRQLETASAGSVPAATADVA